MFIQITWVRYYINWTTQDTSLWFKTSPKIGKTMQRTSLSIW